MPVVVTNVGEIPSLIQDGLNGFMVDTGNVDLFFDALVKLIDNEILQDDFGKALQQTISNVCSEQTVVKKYLDWLE
jgi:glycosyltransferase involved in cell wall biosynthesis